jgi:cyclic pyranopterin phosphate synthase
VVVSGSSYLRAIVTTRCPMRCPYCHEEGDEAVGRRTAELGTAEWIALLQAGSAAGVRKLKLLGGEPLARPDLPAIIAGVRAVDPSVDISIITSGVVPRARLDACFAAGLSRANVSIHGFGPAAFAERHGTEAMLSLRSAFIAALLEHGRPVKLNYVYRGRADEPDLGGLLAWAAPRPVVVNVLDDLRRDLDHQALIAAVTRLRGAPARTIVEHDPCSLDTLRLHWADGLEVEIKHERLGVVAPWRACAWCAVRTRCREGINAIRLDHGGALRLCMDRPELALPLAPLLRTGNTVGVAARWRGFLGEVAA